MTSKNSSKASNKNKIQRATKILTEIAITNQQKRASAVILQMS